MAAQNKTKPTAISPEEFIEQVEHPVRQGDAKALDMLFRKVTQQRPCMWGPTIIGYGQYHYRYESGHEGEMCRAGFSPRKARHSLYLSSCGKDLDEAPFAALLDRLGKYSRGKGCLYVNKLADVDMSVLEDMIALSWRNSHERYPG